MKKWQIVLLAILAAVSCGCVGLLLGFTVGFRIGERRVLQPGSGAVVQIVMNPIKSDHFELENVL